MSAVTDVGRWHTKWFRKKNLCGNNNGLATWFYAWIALMPAQRGCQTVGEEGADGEKAVPSNNK